MTKEDERMKNDLEAFLSSIKMSHLLDKFVKNKILLKDLLCFKEADLEKVCFYFNKLKTVFYLLDFLRLELQILKVN